MAHPLTAHLRTRRKARLLRLARRLGGEPLLFRLSRWLYRLRVAGEDRIPSRGPCILVFNHASVYVDSLVYLVLHRHRPDTYLFHWSLTQGEITQLLDAFDLPASRLLSAYHRQGLSAAELLRARQALLDGGAIALAPEGEPSWDGSLQHPLAPGAAWLALRTAAPVVPVVSLGGYDVQPVWQVEKIRLTGRIRIRIGQPFYLCHSLDETVTQASVQAASQRIWDEMYTLLAQAD